MLKALRLPDVIEATKLSKSSIYRKIKANTFPKQSPLADRSVGWKEEDIQDWLAWRFAHSKSENEPWSGYANRE